jgi:26S proteasome regulatory subunit N1
MEAKTPEDVYKMHLVEGRAPTGEPRTPAGACAIFAGRRLLHRCQRNISPRQPTQHHTVLLFRAPAGPAADSARANLASTFVNAFVNAGFGQDKLVTAAAEGGDAESGDGAGVHWIFRNKDHGKLSAAASLGLVLLWDVEGGLPQVDRFLYATDPHVVAGALLAVGIVACGVVDDVDPAYAILSDYVGRPEEAVRTGAALGLGIAYAGREKAEVAELLLPLVLDGDAPADVAGTAALAVALSFVGTASGEAVEAVLQAMMVRPEADLASGGGRLMSLALGLLFLGRREAVEATVEVARTLPDRVSRLVRATLEVCAYAGTGDVLRVQQLLAACGERVEAEGGEGWRAAHQTVAALGLGLVSMGEELGAGMAHRGLEHLLQYGEAPARRGVPLALALLNVSRPDVTVMDTLARLSHDVDAEVAANAVLALGVIGAGTNNARLAGLLRNLSAYYGKDPTLLFLVRVAQGLVHAGKGLLTLSPLHADGAAVSRPALAGLLAVLFCGLDLKGTLAGRAHHLLYCLAPALRPRMLMTVDEAGAMLAVPVRVGQAVDVVAQAGRPKAVTGFQTHTTPVLLSAGERAELGTDKYVAVAAALEGVVILRPNPDAVE